MWTRLLRTPITLLAACLAAALVVVGCTGADDSGPTADEAVQRDGVDEAGSDVAAGGDADDAATEAAAAEPDGADPESDDGESAAEPSDDGAAAPEAAAGRELIYRATVTLASDDPDDTAAQVRSLATDAGGFVSGTDLTRDELGLLHGSITIRVPAERLDVLLDQVSASAAQVTALDRTVEDVTGQVADIEARLRNLRALEDELVVLLTEAREGGDTEDVLDVFDRVGEVRGEIEGLEGRRTELGEQVALSTLTVVVEPTPSLVASRSSTPDEDLPLPWDPGDAAASSWDSTVAAVQGFVDAVIRLVVFTLPVALVWLSPLLVVALLVWRWRGRRPDGGRSVPPPRPGGSGPVDREPGNARPDVHPAGVSGSIDGEDGSEPR